MSKNPEEILARRTGVAFAENAIINWLRERPRYLRKAVSLDDADELGEWFLGLLDDSEDRLRSTETGNSLTVLKRLHGASFPSVDWPVVRSVLTATQDQNADTRKM